MMHMEDIPLLALGRNPPQLERGQLGIRAAVGEDQRFFRWVLSYTKS